MVNASRLSIELDRSGGCVVAERLSELERWRIAELAAQGSTTRLIAKEIGRGHGVVAKHLRLMRRPPPRAPVPAASRLSLVEREEISRGLAGGESLRAIAARLGRASSTISREVAANGGRHRYRACGADKAAVRRMRRPKLLRQYFPKRTEISHFTQADLDDVAADSTEDLDKPSAGRHHHKHSTKRCDDPLNRQAFCARSLLASRSTGRERTHDGEICVDVSRR
jgi:transposase, IS30 family